MQVENPGKQDGSQRMLSDAREHAVGTSGHRAGRDVNLVSSRRAAQPEPHGSSVDCTHLQGRSRSTTLCGESRGRRLVQSIALSLSFLPSMRVRGQGQDVLDGLEAELGPKSEPAQRARLADWPPTAPFPTFASYAWPVKSRLHDRSVDARGRT